MPRRRSERAERSIHRVLQGAVAVAAAVEEAQQRSGLRAQLRDSVTVSGWGWLSKVKDYGSAILSHPEIGWGALETVVSVALTNAGGDAVLGGAVLCLTGVGCIAGAFTIAGGLSLAGAGATGAKDGIGRINDGLGKALREADSEDAGPPLSALWVMTGWHGHLILEREVCGRSLGRPEILTCFA